MNIKDMLGRAEALPPGEALERLLKAASHTISERLAEEQEEEVAIEEAYGRVLAEELICPEELPPFSRSTVDGFAVPASNTFGATETNPAYLNIKGEILMAGAAGVVLEKGEAAKIPTGGMLPQGADAVVMLEHANQVDETLIEVLKPAAPGQNVIERGQDAKQGDIMLKRGSVLRPQDVAACAGVGITSLRVYKKPRVSIIVTGDEILPPSSGPLSPGFIRDINSYNLTGLLLKEAALPIMEGIFGDDYGVLKAALEAALAHSDMVLITGGSSVGQKDFTARLIGEKGTVVFHGVSLKPGKPTIGGIIDNKPVFGLPGHPAAINVCFEVFIRPVLSLLRGVLPGVAPSVAGGTVSARLTKDISAGAGKTQYVRVSLFMKDGHLWAEPILGPSGLITTLVKSDGAVVVPPNRPGLNKGEIVEVKIFNF